MSTTDKAATLDDFTVLAGEWEVELTFPTDPPGVVQGGRTTFEWLFDEFLVQRMGPPGAAQMIAIIAHNPEQGTLQQHYFDSRGVVRIYDMTLDDGVWTLLRTKADFVPLEFAQRFTGRLTDDANTIHGRWEGSSDGVSWQHDFDMIYRRAR